MKTPNTVYHNATITRQKRENLNNHKSVVIWFTGLSGSGKSTLAHSAEEELHKLGCRTFVLDGDKVRHGPSSNLTFSDADRKENIKRIGSVLSIRLHDRDDPVVGLDNYNNFKKLVFLRCDEKNKS